MDANQGGFDCTDLDDNRVFLHFGEGTHLVCHPLDDFEMYLKSCVTQMTYITPTCRYNTEKELFTCNLNSVRSVDIPLALADNYFCITEQDKRRIDDRCKN